MSTAPDSTPSLVQPGPATGPTHEAVAYSSPSELAAVLARRAGPALTAGDDVTAVVDDEARKRLQDQLGDAATDVHFLAPATVHVVPGFTTAVRWARSGRRVAHPAGRALILAQQLLDLPGCGPEYWTRLCVGLEVTGIGVPLTVLCAFRDEAAEWARVRQTHQALVGRDGWEPNPDFRPPTEVITEHPPDPRPELGPPAADLEFRATDLGDLRHLTAEVGGRGGLPSDRIADAVLAVNELASNSIEHGPGTGRLRLWTDGRAGLLAEIADRGRLNEPFPGMSFPAANGARGRGLWLASELCDVMEVWTDDGTVVRVSWLP